MDDEVDEMNDAAFYSLSSLIKERPELTPQSLNALIISRNLERVGDHATNIAEDVIFWVKGSDVRHIASLDRRLRSASWAFGVGPDQSRSGEEPTSMHRDQSFRPDGHQMSLASRG